MDYSLLLAVEKVSEKKKANKKKNLTSIYFDYSVKNVKKNNDFLKNLEYKI